MALHRPGAPVRSPRGAPRARDRSRSPGAAPALARGVTGRAHRARDRDKGGRALGSDGAAERAPTRAGSRSTRATRAARDASSRRTRAGRFSSTGPTSAGRCGSRVPSSGCRPRSLTRTGRPGRREAASAPPLLLRAPSSPIATRSKSWSRTSARATATIRRGRLPGAASGSCPRRTSSGSTATTACTTACATSATRARGSWSDSLRKIAPWPRRRATTTSTAS